MAEINSLLFVKDLPEPRPDGGSRTFWAPDCAGLDYTAACDLGHDLALEAVRYMRAKNMVGLLAWAVAEMPRPARGFRDLGDGQAGVMAGFLCTIARLAMDAATPARLAAYERAQAAWQAYWRRLVAEEERRERARERRRARRAAP